jgi:hypothetical protein
MSMHAGSASAKPLAQKAPSSQSGPSVLDLAVAASEKKDEDHGPKLEHVCCGSNMRPQSRMLARTLYLRINHSLTR